MGGPIGAVIGGYAGHSLAESIQGSTIPKFNGQSLTPLQGMAEKIGGQIINVFNSVSQQAQEQVIPAMSSVDMDTIKDWMNPWLMRTTYGTL